MRCLKRRLPDEFALGTELVAWEKPRNDAKVTIRWKFTVQDARRVFARYYPAPQNQIVKVLAHLSVIFAHPVSISAEGGAYTDLGTPSSWRT